MLSMCFRGLPRSRHSARRAGESAPHSCKLGVPGFRVSPAYLSSPACAVAGTACQHPARRSTQTHARPQPAQHTRSSESGMPMRLACHSYTGQWGIHPGRDADARWPGAGLLAWCCDPRAGAGRYGRCFAICDHTDTPRRSMFRISRPELSTVRRYARGTVNGGTRSGTRYR